jgi:hypothetical protein
MAKGQATAPQPEVTIEPIDPQTVEPFKRDLAQRLNREEVARSEREIFNELVEWLLSISNEKDNPKLSGIDNQRRRYAETLLAISIYFKKIDHDEHPELWTYIAGLGIALRDLIEGVTDPLFVTKGSKRDSMRIWGARLQAALGLKCWIQSGMSRDTAANEAATKYPALAKLIRIAGADLRGALLSWYDCYSYVEGKKVEGEKVRKKKKVPVPELLEAFQETRRAIKAAKLSPAEYRRIGQQYFERAAKAVRRPHRAGFRQIT